jgi:hypothetical protein
MDKINNLISQNPIHITTNTVILVLLALVALYILVNVISSIIKIVAVLAICWFILMSVQSTNIADIPIVNKAYTEIERIIPSKELWKQATEYINYQKNEIQNKVNQ